MQRTKVGWHCGCGRRDDRIGPPQTSEGAERKSESFVIDVLSDDGQRSAGRPNPLERDAVAETPPKPRRWRGAEQCPYHARERTATAPRSSHRDKGCSPR